MNNYFVRFCLTGYNWRGTIMVERGFRVEAASAKEAEEKGIHRMEGIIKQHPRIYKGVSFELVSCEEVKKDAEIH